MTRESPLKLVSVTPLNGWRLQIHWQSHGEATVDLTDMIQDNPALKAAFQDPNHFSRAQVGTYGWTVVWDDHIELGADSLYRLACYQSGTSLPPEAFAHWRRTNRLSQRQAAMELGISERMLKYYEEGRYLIPKTVMLACKGYDALHGRAA